MCVTEEQGMDSPCCRAVLQSRSDTDTEQKPRVLINHRSCGFHVVYMHSQLFQRRCDSDTLQWERQRGVTVLEP